jgi:hypothetical protein
MVAQQIANKSRLQSTRSSPLPLTKTTNVAIVH